MLTYRTGAAGAPSAATAMAKHLLEHTLPAEDMKVAEYYAQGRGVDEALAEGMGCVPTPRGDMHPDLAKALGIEAGKLLRETELANILGGRRADGDVLPGHQRDVTRYAAEHEGEQDRIRISYMDLCLSAPKSASLAWAFAGTDAERNSILQAHRSARDATLRYIEDAIGRAGFGHGRQEGEERGHLAWITCDHFTARPTVAVTQPDPETGVVDTELHTLRVAGDPQLHTHCIVPNVMVTASGRIVSVNRDLLDGRIHEFGAVYQGLLATELRAIGIEVELCERTHMARLPAIPEAVCDEFSKRTHDAEEAARTEAQRRGLDWDGMAPQARIDFLKGGAHASRQFKADDLSDIRAWRGQAERLGWTHKSAIAYGPPAPARNRAERLAEASQTGLPLLGDELAKRAVIAGGDVRLAAARGLIAAGIESTDDVGAVTREWATTGVQQDGQRTHLIWREGDNRKVKVTTTLHRDHEAELVRLARQAAGDRRHSLTLAEVDAAVKRSGITYDGAHGEAQRRAVQSLATDGGLGIVIGVAGTGKTTRVLPPLVEAWQARGSEVWGTALAWRQANALQDAGIAASHTRALQPFLDAAGRGDLNLHRNSIVVLDELGQVGTRQVLELLRLQDRHGFKLVATGDDRQCQSIEAGPVIELLRRALGEDRIPEILSTVRQHTEEERHIAGLFRAGDAAAAIKAKVANNTAELVEGGYRDAVRRVATLYRERREATAGTPGYTVSISAPTNADAREISRAVRDERRAMGELSEDRTTVRATDGRGGAYSLALAEGDNVRLFARTRAVFTDAAGRRKSANIGDNGTVLQVVAVRPGEGLNLRGPSGKIGFVSWDALRDREGTGRLLLTYGDCGTIDSSQGITSDEHINAMPAGSRAVQAFKGYVAESRHRVRSWLVGSMGAELREAMTRRPMGLPTPETPEARRGEAWGNVARNLARTPMKESALAFLEGAEQQRRMAAQGLQAGLRTHEAREAAGERATTLRRTFGERQARQAMPRLVDQMERVARQRAPLIQRIAAVGAAQASRQAPHPGRAPRPRPARQEAAVPIVVQLEQAPVQALPSPPTLQAPREASAAETDGHPSRAAAAVQPTMPAAHRPKRVKVSELEAQQQFADAMRAHGLKPQGMPIMDGKLRYVAVEGNKGREKSGAYRAFYDEGRPAGAIYNWKHGGFVATWRAEGQVVELSTADQAALAARAEAQAAQREGQRMAREEAGARIAESLSAAGKPADASHPYLAAKGVQPHGLRQAELGQTVPVQGADGAVRQVSIAGRLLVPLRDVQGRVRNLQTIAPDGNKLYLGGAQKSGTFHLIGTLESDRPVLIVEGFATGATVHQATGLPVAVALDTSNLMAVGMALREQMPARPIYFAADNDHHLPIRENPLPNAGKDKAEAAAAEVGGIVLLPPPVAGRETAGKGTDWNDYAAHYGFINTRKAMQAAGLPETMTYDAHRDMLVSDKERQILSAS